VWAANAIDRTVAAPSITPSRVTAVRVLARAGARMSRGVVVSLETAYGSGGVPDPERLRPRVSRACRPRRIRRPSRSDLRSVRSVPPEGDDHSGIDTKIYNNLCEIK